MGRKKLTTEEVKQRIYELVGNEYELLSEYVNARTKFKIRHNKCGCEYEVIWNAFQQGKRCPKCAGTMKLTTKEIKERIYSIEGNEYELLSEYVNAKTKIKIKHNKCGHQFETLWGDFQQGNRCPKCGGTMKLTNEDIIQKIYELVGDEYTKLDNSYSNSKTKFKIRHEKCKFEYKVSWNVFQRGVRCPRCNESKGEKEVAEYLTNHNISFATQVRFDDCRHKKSLPFDFGIIDSEKKIVALIEYDGIQHFEPVERFGGEEKLEITQLRDQIKNEYCTAHNIPLLRIKYNEDVAEKLGLFFISFFKKREWTKVINK